MLCRAFGAKRCAPEIGESGRLRKEVSLEALSCERRPTSAASLARHWRFNYTHTKLSVNQRVVRKQSVAICMCVPYARSSILALEFPPRSSFKRAGNCAADRPSNARRQPAPKSPGFGYLNSLSLSLALSLAWLWLCARSSGALATSKLACLAKGTSGALLGQAADKADELGARLDERRPPFVD